VVQDELVNGTSLDLGGRAEEGKARQLRVTRERRMQ
jgi:hypothetical protein